MNIFTIVRIALLSVATLFICIGTGVEQLKNEVSGTTIKMFLYGVKVGGGNLIKFKDATTCKGVYQRWDAAYAFAIISCLVIGFALLAVIASLFLKGQAKLLSMASAGLSVCGFVTTLISWSIVAAIYNGKFCGATASYNKSGYDMVGTALIIVTWLILIVDVALAALGIIKGDASAAVEANA